MLSHVYHVRIRRVNFSRHIQRLAEAFVAPEMAQDEANTSISSLLVAGLPNESRLLPSACCPDKDLVILLSRSADADVVSLWTIQGAKKWEIRLSSGDTVTALTWAPNGRHFLRESSNTNHQL